MKAPIFSAFADSQQQTRRILKKLADHVEPPYFHIENHSQGCSSVVQARDKREAREKYRQQFPDAANDHITATVTK